MSKSKCLILSLLLVILFGTTGCEELMEDIVKSMKIYSKAKSSGKIWCHDEAKPYRIGGIRGVCVGDEEMKTYVELVMDETEDEIVKNYITVQKAKLLGQKKNCPSDKPYYVRKLLFMGDCLSASELSSKVGDLDDWQVNADEKPIAELISGNEANFESCQDIVYAKLTGSAPPKGDVSKSIVYDTIVQEGFDEVKKGYVAEGSGGATFLDIQEGDIIMLEFNDYPDIKNAAHYAIYEDGKFHQILRFKDYGQYDVQTDPNFFFKPRSGVKHDGTEWSSPNVYQYYRIYRKTE